MQFFHWPLTPFLLVAVAAGYWNILELHNLAKSSILYSSFYHSRFVSHWLYWMWIKLHSITTWITLKCNPQFENDMTRVNLGLLHTSSITSKSALHLSLSILIKPCYWSTISNSIKCVKKYLHKVMKAKRPVLQSNWSKIIEWANYNEQFPCPCQLPNISFFNRYRVQSVESLTKINIIWIWKELSWDYAFFMSDLVCFQTYCD